MKDLTKRIAALDLSEEAAHLAALKEQSQELTTARERGHKRMLEIAREIEALKAGRGDGESAAEALLAGDNVALAAPQRQALEEERASIKAGMANLAEREREVSSRRAAVVDIIDSKSSAAVEDYAVELERRARVLSLELATIMAAADAVGYGAGNSRAVRVAASLRTGIAGLRRVDPLVPTEVNAPADLVKALEASPARPLLRRHIPRTVRI